MLPNLLTTPAFAHASERGHVLLLPTGYYLVGGALAVAASFAVLIFIRPSVLAAYARARFTLLAGVSGRRDFARLVTSGASCLALLALVLAGFLGSHDPLANPLPLVVWTLLWVGFTLLQGLVGNIWHWLDPWYAPWRVLNRALSALVKSRAARTPPTPPTKGDEVADASRFPSPLRGGVRGGGKPDGTTAERSGHLLALPGRLGYWPAVVTFLAFAWFELIDLAPEDPPRLAMVVSIYWAATLVAMLVFGHDAWSRRGEFLSAFFRMISRFAILGKDTGVDGVHRLTMSLPGARIADVEPLPISGAIFLLCVLGSVSFDGLSKTFLWLGANGINPLEFPGRSAVVEINTVGLLAAIAALIAVFFAAVWLGARMVGASGAQDLVGLFVWSIVPIALAYHFSHYLTVLLVDGQYALAAISDPLDRGWNLFGTARFNVEAGIVMGHDAAWAIWNAQAAAIVGGHVVAVLVAHVLALRAYSAPDKATVSQVPLAIFMVFYTLFGLWLLSTPSAG